MRLSGRERRARIPGAAAGRRRFLKVGCCAAAASLAGRALGAPGQGLCERPRPAACRLRGAVSVNGRALSPADAGIRIDAGDSVSTGADGEAVFAVGPDAFWLAPNSRLETEAADGDPGWVRAARLLAGSLLAVFGERREQRPGQLLTDASVIGIRGTGLYLHSAAGWDYLCVCYGSVEVSSERADGPPVPLLAGAREGFHRAQYLSPGADGPGLRIVEDRPPIPHGHRNDQLAGLESLLGRTPPLR